MRYIVSLFLCITIISCHIVTVTADELKLNAKSAVIMGENKQILYEKEGDQKLPNASTTKILTCLYILKNCDIEKTAKVSQNAAMQPKVRLGVRAGEKYKIKDLLYGLMLESYNDCAVVLAEYAEGSVKDFEKKVNEMAYRLGAKQTHFVTPNGLDGVDARGRHETTAKDLATIMGECIKDKEFLEITRTKQYTFSDESKKRTFTCNNHNALLFSMDGMISGKTGFTSKAGYCYVGAIKKNKITMTFSVLASGWPPHKNYKWQDVKKMVQYVTDHYEQREFIADTSKIKSINIQNGLEEKVNLKVEDQKFKMLLKKTDDIKIEAILPSSVEAPIKKHQKVGEIKYMINQTCKKKVPIYTTKQVRKKDYWYYFEKIIQRFTLVSECAMIKNKNEY